MDSDQVEVLAGELYETYSDAVGGVAYNGDPLPKWAEFSVDENKTKQAGGWRAVAEKVISKLPNSAPMESVAKEDVAATEEASAAA